MRLIKLAHEALDDTHSKRCLITGESQVEMHHWQGRGKSKRLGAANEILLTGLVPMHPIAHDKDFRGEVFLKYVEDKIKEGDSEFIRRMAWLGYAAMYQAWLVENRNIWR